MAPIVVIATKPYLEAEVGIGLTSHARGLKITSISDDGLFACRSLQIGMILLRINGIDCKEMDVSAAVGLLRSAEGQITIIADIDECTSSIANSQPGLMVGPKIEVANPDPIEDREDSSIGSKKYLCLPESIFKTEDGRMKRKCWVTAAILNIIVISIVIIIVLVLTSPSDSSTEPTNAPTLAAIVKLPDRLGGSHSCASNYEDKLFVWGRNTWGQLGDNSTTGRSNPTAIDVGFGRSIKQVSLGGYHSCAILDDDSLKCWGYNSYGQVGDGGYNNKVIPTTIDVGNERITKQDTLGWFHSCAVLDNGSLRCWGHNMDGQVVHKSYGNNIVSPTNIFFGPGRTVIQISLGFYYSCALLDDGSLKCWGRNVNGQLGDGMSQTRSNPMLVKGLGGRTVKQVVAGGGHSCATLDDDSLYCWGYNSYGQVGDKTYFNKYIPTKIMHADIGRNIKQVALGGYHTCVVFNDGLLKCWGRNDYGQLGDGTTSKKSEPTVIDVGFERKVTQISLGYYHTCAVLEGTSLRCWGANMNGQLGTGTIGGNVLRASLAEFVDI